MMLARADYLNQGFVLDYQTINSSLTNYTFCGDTTYYISGTVNLYGTNVFEGGAVLKYTNNATISCQSSPQIFASTYRPVIFTAMDDNSVGDPITGSTGNPTNYYAGTALILPNNSNLSFQYLRISNAKSAIGVGGTLSLTNVQMVNCQNGVVVNFSQSLNLYMRNVLMGNVRTNVNLINLSGGATLSARNVTFANMPTAGDTNYALVGQGAVSSWSINLTNCILANVTFGFSIGSHLSGYYNGVYPSSAGFGNVITANYPFQNVGGGNYYLTNNSPFINVGSTNIESSLLLGLKKQTTYPPILITNVVISVNNTMSPQAQRDTDAPDLGYHYDPVDYLVNSFWITNATLTLTNGVAIATYNDQGMLVTDGANIKSVGTPLSPNWIVRYSSVQEQSIMLGSSPSGGFPLNPYHLTTAPDGLFRFTKFACPAGGGYHLYDGQPGSPGFSYNNLRVQDCELWNGANNFSGGSNSVAVLMNNLFARSTVTANVSASLPYTNNILAISNNLFWNVTVTLLSRSSSNSWYVFNNDFDGCTNKTTGIGGQQPTINGYNAYLNCNGQLYPTNIHDIVSASSLSYQVGPLGTFYQPTNSLLINMGSTTADLVGLYHYTVTTNMVSGMEIKETNSVVDIGYHYVAVNGASSPIDTDGDGIPDYLEDANGNGLVDGSENSWTNYNSGNGLVSPNGLIIFTPLK